MIINEVTKENNKVPGDESNENFKLHRLERIMEESVSIFQSVVEAEQNNCGPQQKLPLAENENPTSRSNHEHGVDKSIKR